MFYKQIMKYIMSEEKEVKIKLSDRVKLVATDKAKHYKAGDTFEVHPKQAEALIKAGKAEKAKK